MPSPPPTESTRLLSFPDSGAYRNPPTSGRKQVAIVIVIAIASIGLIFLVYSLLPTYNHAFKSANYYEISDSASGLYLRVDNSTGGTLMVSKAFPWISGSRLTIEIVDKKCMKIRASSNKWVRYSNGIFRADEPSVLEATCLQYQRRGEHLYGLSILVEKKVRYVTTSIADLYLDGVYDMGLIASPDRRDMTIWNIVMYRPFRGVNLGGWFIPEYWMMPSFYSGTGLKWNSSLCEFVRINPSLAEDRMVSNIKSWITEDDLTQIASLGFNSVRIPVGYWNIIEDPYRRFAPRDVHVSLSRLDWCFEAALRHNLSVLIDLHGAPGSQNGNDHSGCQNGTTWATSYNVNLTLATIETIASRFSHFSNFLGVELLNEPGLLLEEQNRELLLEYYERAYDIVRTYSETALVVFNELYPQFYATWDSYLLEPKYYNIVLDVHLYDWQEPYTTESATRHLLDAKSWRQVIENLSIHHPVVVGEWSYSTGTVMQVGQSFVNISLKSFLPAAGWYIWTWKLEQNIGFDMWNVQLQSGLEGGIRAYL